MTTQLHQGTDAVSSLIHYYHSQGFEVQQVFTFQAPDGSPKLYALLKQHRD